MATINWLTNFLKYKTCVYCVKIDTSPSLTFQTSTKQKEARGHTALFTVEPNVSCGQIDIEKKV